MGYNAGTGSGNYANTINLGSSIWALFNYNSTTDQVLSGAISGAGNITKSGTANLTLSGVNTYSGSTTLSGGTLTVGNNLALQNSPLAIGAAGTLTFGNGVTTPTFGGSRAAATSRPWLLRDTPVWSPP